jgi:hypothetical protein
MKSYVWTIDSTLAPHLRGSGGVSPSYVMPRALMSESPESIAGARLWVVLRSPRRSFLFGKLHVDVVELFEDGMNAGDFCLTVDLSKSFVCSRKIDVSVDSFKTFFTSGRGTALLEADEETDARMIDIVERNVTIKLQEFPKALLKKIEDVSIKGDVSSKARALISATTAALCLDELWGSGGKPKMPPFANFAYRWLTEYCPEEASQDMRKVLSDLDPANVARMKREPSIDKKLCEKKSVPSIDVQLSPIDPDKIFARRFVAKDPFGFDYVEAIEKTEHAEKRHQDMLREIVSRLRSVGLNPMQSSSIDLFLQFQEKSLVFELKTATLNNLTSQCAKGLFQLGCYGDALNDNGYENIHPALIIESTGQPELDAYAAKIIASFDVTAFFYYPEKSWPQKVSAKNETLEKMLSFEFRNYQGLADLNTVTV